MEHMEKRIEETHKADWHRYAGAGSLISIILPVLSEFEGIGEDVILGIGGAGAASAFAILMKVGRVTAAVNGLQEEQDEIHADEDEKFQTEYRKDRVRRKKSEYLNDPIGWDDTEYSADFFS